MTSNRDAKHHHDQAAIHVPRNENSGVPQIGEVQDLADRLRFSPQEGRIWLDDERVILFRGSVLSALRRELLALGQHNAQEILTRIGYAAGARDAAMALSLRKGKGWSQMFAVGPQLHALEGFVAVEPVRIEIDATRRVHYVEQLWHHSAEADAHVSVLGLSSTPVCWMQTGYASGFNSTLFERPILFREVECVGAGAPHCRIIGKPLEEWQDGDTQVDQRIIRMKDLANIDRPRAGPQFKDIDGNVVTTRDALTVVGASPSFLTACEKLQQVAPTNATVLLQGETGVGKERFARLLHRLSARSKQPLVALNCAALPESLLESELFGVERGAFTGAVQPRKGRFEEADGGTLFLDEIGTLNESSQAKLLRALQERKVERLGGGSTRNIDVRVVAATNANLAQLVRDGRFRADLFYRLNVFPIVVPPLRERRDDIALMIHHFVSVFSSSHHKTIPGFSTSAIAALLAYEYPGNVRELENIIERGVIMATEGEPIDHQHLFQDEVTSSDALLALDGTGGICLASHKELHGTVPLVEDLAELALDSDIPLREFESAAIQAAVRRSNGNLSQAARQLGISRAQLAYRYRLVKRKRPDAASTLHEMPPTENGDNEL